MNNLFYSRLQTTASINSKEWEYNLNDNLTRLNCITKVYNDDFQDRSNKIPN